MLHLHRKIGPPRCWKTSFKDRADLPRTSVLPGLDWVLAARLGHPRWILHVLLCRGKARVDRVRRRGTNNDLPGHNHSLLWSWLLQGQWLPRFHHTRQRIHLSIKWHSANHLKVCAKVWNQTLHEQIPWHVSFHSNRLCRTLERLQCWKTNHTNYNLDWKQASSGSYSLRPVSQTGGLYLGNQLSWCDSRPRWWPVRHNLGDYGACHGWIWVILVRKLFDWKHISDITSGFRLRQTRKQYWETR